MTDRFGFRRRTILKATLAAGGVAATQGALSVFAARAADPKLVSMRSTSKSWLWAPEDFAQGGGMFEKAGIGVEITATQRGVNTDALIGGGADIVLGSPDNNIRIAMQGQPVKMIGGFVDKFASHIVVKQDILDERGVSESSAVPEKIQALKGLKLGTTGPGGGPDNLFRYLMLEGGLEPDRDAQLVRIQGGGQGMLAGMQQGAIDGFCLSSPTSDVAVSKFGAGYLFNMATNPPPDLSNYLYIVASTTEKTIAEKRPQLVAYLRGVGMALKAIREDEAAFKVWAKEFFADLDPEIFETAYASNHVIYTPTPVATPEQYDLIRRFVDLGLKTLGRDPVPDSLTFEKAWDVSLAEEAMKG